MNHSAKYNLGFTYLLWVRRYNRWEEQPDEKLLDKNRAEDSDWLTLCDSSQERQSSLLSSQPKPIGGRISYKGHPDGRPCS
jgi:hypothetical protein